MLVGKFLPALKLLDEFAERLIAANDAATAEMLHNCIARVKQDAAALELLRQLFLKLGVSAYLNEVSELLAHALVQKGELKKAREIYRQLAELEPENPLHAQNYRQLSIKLGEDPLAKQLPKDQASAPMMVDELESAVTEVQQKYSPEVEAAIRAALTDSELFESYNQSAKSITPLEAALAKAPGDLRLNQRLAMVYRRAERFEDAARSCVVLEKMFEHYGHTDRAREFGSLAEKYASQAGCKVPKIDIIALHPARAGTRSEDHEFEIEIEAAEPALQEFDITAAAETNEIDLSDWESQPEEAAGRS